MASQQRCDRCTKSSKRHAFLYCDKFHKHVAPWSGEDCEEFELHEPLMDKFMRALKARQHVHFCPVCQEDKGCIDTCDSEVQEDGTRRAVPWTCDDCQAIAEENAQRTQLLDLVDETLRTALMDYRQHTLTYVTIEEIRAQVLKDLVLTLIPAEEKEES
jgi:hypothetical protein